MLVERKRRKPVRRTFFGKGTADFDAVRTILSDVGLDYYFVWSVKMLHFERNSAQRVTARYEQLYFFFRGSQKHRDIPSGRAGFRVDYFPGNEVSAVFRNVRISGGLFFQNFFPTKPAPSVGEHQVV